MRNLFGTALLVCKILQFALKMCLQVLSFKPLEKPCLLSGIS